MAPGVATSISCLVLSASAIHLDHKFNSSFEQVNHYELTFGDGCPIHVTPLECQELADKAPEPNKFSYEMTPQEKLINPPEGCYKYQTTWFYNMGPRTGPCTPARPCVCRTDVPDDKEAVTMPAQGFRERFPAAPDAGLFGPEDGLFRADEWEFAISTAFGADVLRRSINEVPHGDGLKAAIAAPCTQMKDKDMKAPFKSAWDSCGDKAYNRAMSVANLEKVKVFIETLAAAKNGLIANPGKFNGGFCRETAQTEKLDNLAKEERKDKSCKSNSDCKPTEKCMPELVAPEKVTMYILDAILVQPLTRFTRSSLVGHIGGGRPDVFISHAWGGTFYKFLQSVLIHYYNTPGRKSKDKTYYWVCTFGVNQHMADIEVGAGIYGPFWGGIQLSKEVIAIQDDKEADIWFTLGRGWCVWEMMVTLMFGKKLRFVAPGGSMFGFNGLLTDDGPGAADRFPHTALKRRLMGFAVEQASGGPKEAMDEIKKIICEKACLYATTILGKITNLPSNERQIYADAWTTNQDGLECFEDVFQIAGNLIESSNALDNVNKGRRNGFVALDGSKDEKMIKAAVGGLSEKKRKILERKLDGFLPGKIDMKGEATPSELEDLATKMTAVGYLAPDSTGHCFQKNSECPEGPDKERNKPATVNKFKDIMDQPQDLDDDIVVAQDESAPVAVPKLEDFLKADLLQVDDGRVVCESGRKKKILPKDSDSDSGGKRLEKLEQRFDEIKNKTGPKKDKIADSAPVAASKKIADSAP